MALESIMLVKNETNIFSKKSILYKTKDRINPIITLINQFNFYDMVKKESIKEITIMINENLHEQTLLAVNYYNNKVKIVSNYFRLLSIFDFEISNIPMFNNKIYIEKYIIGKYINLTKNIFKEFNKNNSEVYLRFCIAVDKIISDVIQHQYYSELDRIDIYSFIYREFEKENLQKNMYEFYNIY